MYQAVPARDFAILAQLVERIHGKDEVPSSILGDGSKTQKPDLRQVFVL